MMKVSKPQIYSIWRIFSFYCSTMTFTFSCLQYSWNSL